MLSTCLSEAVWGENGAKVAHPDARDDEDRAKVVMLVVITGVI